MENFTCSTSYAGRGCYGEKTETLIQTAPSVTHSCASNGIILSEM